MATPTTGLEPFTEARHVRLSTYARDGSPVGGAAHIAVDGDRAYVRTSGRGAHVERLDRYPEVEIAPSTGGGVPTGAPMKAYARRLDGTEARAAARRLARKHPLMHGVALPLGSALRMDRPALYELRLPGG